MRELAIRWINLRKRGVTLGEPRGKRGIAHCHQGRTPQARSAENHPARRRRGGIGERRDRQHDELPCRRALLASQNRPGIGSAPTSREPVLSRFSSPRTQRPKAIRARSGSPLLTRPNPQVAQEHMRPRRARGSHARDKRERGSTLLRTHRRGPGRQRAWLHLPDRATATAGVVSNVNR
jgi:hypothetical protein